MDLLLLLPPPLITLAIQLAKKVGLPENAAPWLALGLAVVSTIVVHVLGFTPNATLDIIAFVVAWLGSMGTWEAIKNLIIRTWVNYNARPTVG